MKLKFYSIFLLFLTKIAYSQTVQVLDVCDDLNGWGGGASISLDQVDVKQGTASLVTSGDHVVRFQKNFSSFNSGVDMSTGYMSVWVYVSDLSKTGIGETLGVGEIEITSSGGPDVNELHWETQSLVASGKLISGWNHLILPLISGNPSGGQVDLSKIDFFRFYILANESITTKIDNIQFFDNLSVLPVELISYSASLKNNQVKIEWESSSEVESAYFDLQRSFNNEDFSSIGIISSKGNNSKYTVVDNAPLKGANYYQLLQYDNNGKFKNYGVKVVSYGLGNSSKLIVYPNPVSKEFNVNLNDYTGKDFEVRIVDLLGKTVFYKKVAIDQNNSNYSFSNNEMALKGMHMVKINGTNLNEYFKLMFE